jgi:pimeloyl-ACP methyl ester carboxylesterase
LLRVFFGGLIWVRFAKSDPSTFAGVIHLITDKEGMARYHPRAVLIMSFAFTQPLLAGNYSWVGLLRPAYLCPRSSFPPFKWKGWMLLGIALLLLLALQTPVAQEWARSPAIHSEGDRQTAPLPNKQSFKLNGHGAFIILPKQTDLEKPIPWVWYAPTLPGLPEARENWMFDQFLAKGIAIAGIDVGESYGSPDGRKGYSAFYQELITNRGFAPKATLLARSRGGLMLYNWACENPDKVACIAGIYPVCDLRSYPGLDKASKTYGLTLAELEMQLDQHNPVSRLTPLAKAGVPIFHIHGDIDKVVPLQQNSGEMKRRYDKLGGKMVLKIAQGQGHNLWDGFFQCQELVDFVIVNTRGTSKPSK